MSDSQNRSILLLVSTDLNYDQRMMRICKTLSKEFTIHLCGHKKKHSKKLNQRSYLQSRLSTWFRSGVAFYAELNIRFFFKFLGDKSDIIVSNDLDTMPAAYLLSRMGGKKLVFDAHEFFTEVPELIDSPWKKRIWTWIGKRGVPQADLRYTVNQSLSSVLEKKYAVSFEVIRNSTEYRETEDLPKADRFTIIYQGAVNRGRGIDLAIDALADFEEFDLWIAGDGDLLEEMQAKAREKTYSDRIRFYGYVEPERLRRLTAQAHLGLNLLSPQSRSYQLSLANKFYDYVHAGIPAIHPDFIEYKTLLDQYPVGYCIENYSVGSLQGLLRHILDSPQEYRDLAENCQRYQKKLSWEEECVELLRLYREL